MKKVNLMTKVTMMMMIIIKEMVMMTMMIADVNDIAQWVEIEKYVSV